MKKKLLTGLLVLTLALTSSFVISPAKTVHANDVVTEITNDKIAFKDASLVNSWNEHYELTAGQYVVGTTAAVDENGKALEFGKDWTFIDDEDLAAVGLQVQFYSKYDDAEKASLDTERGDFSETIPVEAFGKYVYKWVAIGLLDKAGNITSDIAFKLLRSEYTITDWGDTDYQTFSLNNDNKTVTVFTIYNRAAEGSPFDASFQKTVTINGKKYKVTDIGDYALDNYEGATGMVSVKIHSGIKTIGKEAFKGAKKLKTITIEGNVTKIGKNAFKDIDKKAVFKIKASNANYKKIVKLLKKSGVAKTVTFKRFK